MTEHQPAVAEIAALVGNPARANILMALIDGRALTASELAYVAGVSPQTTSEHLAKLREANLLSLTKQGRHCYFRLGSPKVARMIEGIMVVAADATAAISAALERRRAAAHRAHLLRPYCRPSRRGADGYADPA